MAEASRFWTTNGTGDGSTAGYTSDNFSQFVRDLMITNAATEGVIKGIGNGLAVTYSGSSVFLDTGAAIVGSSTVARYYKNDASLTVGTVTTGSHTDIVVLRMTFASQTIRAAIKSTTTTLQQDGTIWEILLATLTVVGGSVTAVTDGRTYAKSPIAAGWFDNALSLKSTLAASGAISTSGAISSSGNITTSGAITAVGTVTGGTLASGGAITATTTINATGAITSLGAVTGASLVTGGNASVTGTINATGAITSLGAVTGASLVTGGNLSVTGNIASTGTIIAQNSIRGTSLLTAGAITASGAISGGAISGTTLAISSTITATGSISATGAITSEGAITGASGSFGNVTLTGITGTGVISSANIAANAITTAKILDGNVTAAKIATGAVGSDELATNAVTTAKITDGNVTTAKIAAFNVTAGTINTGAVTTDKILDLNVTTGKLANDAVTSAKIVAAAVGTTELADNSVTAAKIYNGVQYVYKRQGASSTDWIYPGITNYNLTDAVATYCGSVTITCSGTTGSATITFTSFSFGQNPLVFCQLYGTSFNSAYVAQVTSVSASGFTVYVKNIDGVTNGTITVFWTAIGDPYGV